MSTDIPKPTAPRTTGLGPKEQKLQALRDKARLLKQDILKYVAVSYRPFHAH